MARNKAEIIKKNSTYCTAIVMLVIILVLFFVGQKKSSPILLGFSGELTGGRSEVGVQERNGVQLAVEEINAKGGIEGRKISLIINDDSGIANEAEEGDKELIKKDVVAIIGHVTTEQTLAGLKATNPAKIVMISSSVSTPMLSGKDDYFFRVYPSFSKSSRNFAKYIYNQKKYSKISIIYDCDNYRFTHTYSSIFSDEFKSLGGTISDEINFSSVAKPDFSSVVSKLRESDAQAVFIVASDIDTANFTQRARLMGYQVPIFSSAWAQTDSLITNGGKAVEGIEIEQTYDINNKSRRFEHFKSKYKSRFGTEPTYGAIYSYEATMVLKQALIKTNGNKEGLKKALLNIKNYKGLMNTFSFDKFGDVDRSWYLSTIKNGKYTMVDSYHLTDLGGQ